MLEMLLVFFFGPAALGFLAAGLTAYTLGHGERDECVHIGHTMAFAATILCIPLIVVPPLFMFCLVATGGAWWGTVALYRCCSPGRPAGTGLNRC